MSRKGDGVNGVGFFNAGVGDPNSFAPQFDVMPSTQVVSNTITLKAVGNNVPISVTGGEYSLNGAAVYERTEHPKHGQGRRYGDGAPGVLVNREHDRRSLR